MTDDQRADLRRALLEVLTTLRGTKKRSEREALRQRVYVLRDLLRAAEDAGRDPAQSKGER